MAQSTCHRLCSMVMFQPERNSEAFLIFLVNLDQFRGTITVFAISKNLIQETLTTTLVSNTKKKHLFGMDVQQLCMMNFGILVDSIRLYVRFSDFFIFSRFSEKPTYNLRLAKSSIASSNDNLILNLIFMAGLVILLLTLNQRFYFVLIMNTPKNVIRKYSLSITVTAW